jgi:hypothetical protein
MPVAVAVVMPILAATLLMVVELVVTVAAVMAVLLEMEEVLLVQTELMDLEAVAAAAKVEHHNITVVTVVLVWLSLDMIQRHCKEIL